MALTASTVLPYLLQSELINPREIVEGRVSVIDVSRRNRNFKVIRPDGTGLFLKQGVNPDGEASVANEASFYRLINAPKTGRALKRYLPYWHRYDNTAHVLVSALTPRARDLREYHAHRGRFSVIHARALGRALAELHRFRDTRRGDRALSALPSAPPWVLFLHRPDSDFLRRLSAANVELIKILQRYPEFAQTLERLTEAWQPNTVIHGDLKWDNCIVFAPPGSNRRTRLKLVDWELASHGDPSWDVGSVFGDYLGSWLLSVPVTGEAPPERFLDLAVFPLERMTPAMGTFWRAYVRGRGLDTAADRRCLLRAIKYSAVRVIQTAFEMMQTSMQLTGNAVCLLQISLNIMRRPEEACTQLFGIAYWR